MLLYIKMRFPVKSRSFTHFATFFCLFRIRVHGIICLAMTKHRISAVDKGSIAEELGITAGDCLLTINGEPIEDIIDYESLATNERLILLLENESGEAYEAEVEKDAYEPLGLNFETSLMSKLRPCKNHCVFCFIDQLPKGGRETLYVKDDDWRLSLIMGNYITLTNVSDEEFERILKRHVSPLYISVHASDGEIRKRMMNNPTADKLMARLARLKDEGLQFDAQIVLCPGLNDGEVLQKTLNDLYALRPAARSVAVVPVGLTKFREKLYPLRPLTKEEAAAAVDMIEALSSACRAEDGESFAYASDEMYILAGRELPPAALYDDYAQLENGVGLLRYFEEGFLEVLAEKKPLARPLVFDSASGVSAAPFMQRLFNKLLPYGIEIKVHPIINRYFGESVSVSGLITGEDLSAQLCGELQGEALLLPSTMMRERDTTFLDGTTFAELEGRLHTKIHVMPEADGGEFIEKLFEYER